MNREYFDSSYGEVFKEVVKFVDKYNKLPTPESLTVELSESASNEVMSLVKLISQPQEVACDTEWLIDSTEKWCQDKAIYLAIMESISIIDGTHKTLAKTALPDLLSNALGVSFDSNIGHDYIKDSSARYDYYHRTESRVPFDLDYFNKITKGGLPNKTLNIILASTGVGKSLFMTHTSASALMDGRNVLYLTMEMSEEKIAERIDANLMNVPLDSLEGMTRDTFKTKIDKIAQRNIGKLIIKEYPTGSAHVGHFRALLNELKMKKKFVPHIIMIDYLNICSSSRMKGMGGAINSYAYIKSISEEIRGLAVEFDVPILTATQSNRDGLSNTDVDLSNTSDSFGTPMSADLMFALISTEELEGMGQIMVKQLKNRYNDLSKHKRFVIGVDRAKMKLYDVETSAQTLVQDTPSYDNSPKSSNDKFSGFKV